MRTLVSRLAKAEGKKISVSVGNIREVLKCLTELGAEDDEVLTLLAGQIALKKSKKTNKKKN
jgi:hypothetical protein